MCVHRWFIHNLYVQTCIYWEYAQKLFPLWSVEVRLQMPHSEPQRRDRSTHQCSQPHQALLNICSSEVGSFNSSLVTEEEAFPTWYMHRDTHSHLPQEEQPLKQMDSDRQNGQRDPGCLHVRIPPNCHLLAPKCCFDRPIDTKRPLPALSVGTGTPLFT